MLSFGYLMVSRSKECSMFLIGILAMGAFIFAGIYASEVYGIKFPLGDGNERIDDEDI